MIFGIIPFSGLISNEDMDINIGILQSIINLQVIKKLIDYANFTDYISFSNNTVYYLLIAC